MNTKIYIDLAKRVRAKVEDIQHIDLFNNQYEMAADEMPFSTPAVFFEYLPVGWGEGMQGVQEGDAGVRVHIVMSNYEDTANIDLMTPDNETKAIDHYEVTKKVHAALQGYAPCSCTALNRVTTEYDHNHDEILIEFIAYSFSETDATAYKYKNYVQHTPELKVSGDIMKPGETN